MYEPKLKPIIFNTEMVRAILDGRKTVTRRVIKPQPKKDENGNDVFHAQGYNYEFAEANIIGTTGKLKCKPLYKSGDILYVRETWQQQYDGSYAYKAGHKFENEKGWRPSIHMPKEAARIFLRVTNVSVAKLHDIENNDEEAKREGFDYQYMFEGLPIKVSTWVYFTVFWNSTIKKHDIDLYGWNADPWVWVIEFERIEKEAVV